MTTNTTTKKILGLDLGVSSIGWAIIHYNKDTPNQHTIMDSGVKIIPIDTDEKNNFEQGKAQTKNKERTDKRTARKTFSRYKLRRQSLNKILLENGMLPPSDLFLLQSKALYELRSKAVTEQILLQELGRILLLLNQKRGFKSSRKDTTPEKEQSNYKKDIAEREAQLNGRTIGQCFYDKLKVNPLFRIKDKLFNRSTYEKEFDVIWETQSQSYPKVLTNELYRKIKNDIIYYQRPLKSQKHLISECRFEKRTYLNKNKEIISEGIKVAPLSSPAFQEFKLWQSINNLKIIQRGEKEPIYLEDELKQTIYNYISDREKTNAEQLLKKINFSKDEFTINIKKDITGNVTKIGIKKYLIEAGIEANKIKQLLAYDPLQSDDKQDFFLLWHSLYSIENPKDLINTLIKKFDLSQSQAEILCNIKLKEGFGNLSTKAIKKLLPHLQQGLLYNEACDKIGYKHSDSETKEEKEEKIIQPIIHLQHIQRGELRNPAVEKILNHLINLLKDLEENYGKADEVRIELARELQKNAEDRKADFDRNNNAEKENNEIRKKLQEEDYFKHKRVSKNDIVKYKLWKEFNECSPYNPNEKISFASLFNDCEIEHIIPRSRLFDDSFANKTIALIKDNKDKNNDTAYDFMANKRSYLIENYQKLLYDQWKAKKISHKKYKYLLMPQKDIPQDFINRQLNETQYITKKAKEILLPFYKNVCVSSGMVTAYLRHEWGYDTIIENIHLPLYRKFGLTKHITVTDENGNPKTIEKIIMPEKSNTSTNETPNDTTEKNTKGWSKRLDHRHHAIDAIVIAATTQQMINQLNVLNQTVNLNDSNNYKSSKSYRKFDAPFAFEEVKECINNILVSFKAGKRLYGVSKNKINGKRSDTKKHFFPRGALHKEQIYGQVYLHEKINIANFKEEHLIRIVNPKIYQIFDAHLKKYQDNFKKAFALKERENLKYNHQPITELIISQAHYVYKYKLDQNFKIGDVKFIIDPIIQERVKQRLNAHHNNPKEAFKDLDKNPIWFDDKQTIAIKSVRCKTNQTQPQAIRNDKTFVELGNNHHLAIYENENGKWTEEVVSFFDAFQRKINHQPIIQNEHPDFGKLVFSAQQNEMFVFDMTREDLNNAIHNKNYALISQHLYRVRSIYPGINWLVKHFETEIIKDVKSKEMKRCIQASYITFKERNAIKVKINSTGHITLAYLN